MRILYGYKEIADYIQGGSSRGTGRKWIGEMCVRRLIREEGLPASQLRPHSGPFLVSERALLQWLDDYGRKQAEGRREFYVGSSTTGE